MAATEGELVAAIERDPDAPDAYLAYGAYLRARGEVRGELVALQGAGRLEEANALLEAHRERFWGPAAGVLHALTPHEDAQGRPTTWRWGFWESLWVWDAFDYEQRVYGTRALDTAPLLEGLLAHPSARFLRELSIGTLAVDDTYRRLAEIIAQRPRPTLVALLLGDSDEQRFDGTIASLDALAGMDALARLTLIGRVLAPGTRRPPNLHQLRVVTDLSSYDSLPHLCATSWPALESLALDLGTNTIAPAALAPALDAGVFPRVTRLELHVTASPELCEAIGASPIARQIEHLVLRRAALDDRDAEALAAMRFPRLRALDVSSNLLTARGIERLRTLCPSVRADAQDPA